MNGSNASSLGIEKRIMKMNKRTKIVLGVIIIILAFSIGYIVYSKISADTVNKSGYGYGYGYGCGYGYGYGYGYGNTVCGCGYARVYDNVSGASVKYVCDEGKKDNCKYFKYKIDSESSWKKSFIMDDGSVELHAMVRDKNIRIDGYQVKFNVWRADKIEHISASNLVYESSNIGYVNYPITGDPYTYREIFYPAENGKYYFSAVATSPTCKKTEIMGNDIPGKSGTKYLEFNFQGPSQILNVNNQKITESDIEKRYYLIEMDLTTNIGGISTVNGYAMHESEFSQGTNSVNFSLTKTKDNHYQGIIKVGDKIFSNKTSDEIKTGTWKTKIFVSDANNKSLKNFSGPDFVVSEQKTNKDNIRKSVLINLKNAIDEYSKQTSNSIPKGLPASDGWIATKDLPNSNDSLAETILVAKTIDKIPCDPTNTAKDCASGITYQYWRHDYVKGNPKSYSLYAKLDNLTDADKATMNTGNEKMNVKAKEYGMNYRISGGVADETYIKVNNDQQRLSDIATIKTALEAYKKAKGAYPSARGAKLPNNGWVNSNDTSWVAFEKELKPYLPSGTTSLPKDPRNTSDAWATTSNAFTYAYFSLNYGKSASCQWYMLVYRLDDAKLKTSPGVKACDGKQFQYGNGAVTEGVSVKVSLIEKMYYFWKNLFEGLSK